MHIHVNDDWRIRTDPHQFVLEHKTKPKMASGKMQPGGKWAPEGYFSHLHEIWPWLLRKEILAIEIEGELPFAALTALHDAIGRIEADIKAAMKL